MSWTAPRTWTEGETITAALLNTHLRDNMLETEGAKATGGGMFVGTSTNSIVERVPKYASNDATVTTTSTSYVSLGSNNPTVTAATSDRALVLISANFSNAAASVTTWMGIDVSGATTIAATDSNAIAGADTNTAADRQHMGHNLFTTLTAGTNTFSLRYRVQTANTGSWDSRRLLVIPF